MALRYPPPRQKKRVYPVPPTPTPEETAHAKAMDSFYAARRALTALDKASSELATSRNLLAMVLGKDGMKGASEYYQEARRLLGFAREAVREVERKADAVRKQWKRAAEKRGSDE